MRFIVVLIILVCFQYVCAYVNNKDSFSGRESTIEAAARDAMESSYAADTSSLAVIKSSKKTTIRIGAAFGFARYDGSLPRITGIQLGASFMLAIRDLNVMYADRNVTFKFVLRDSHSSFTSAIEAALAINSNSFNGLGVHGYVGNNQSFTTEGADYILQDTDTAHISYGANDTALGRNEVYPGFSRAYPSTSYEGYVLADLCYRQYNWRRILVVYTTDTTGQDALSEFFEYSRTHVDMELISPIAISGDALSNFESQFEAIRAFDPRIFVFLVNSYQQVRELMIASYSLGLLTSQSVVLSTSWNTIPPLQSTLDVEGDVMTNIFSSVTYIGLQLASQDWIPTVRGQAFIKKYISQPSTVINLPNGKTQCLNTTDDDGNFYLYKSCDTKKRCVCTGQNFSTYASDGSNIGALYLLPYVYDTTMALGYAIANYSLRSDGTISVPSKISGKAIKRVLVNNISFEGVTGPVAFISGRDAEINFGRGDRISGVRYAVMNTQSTDATADAAISSFLLRRVGTWSTELGFVSCEGDSIVNTATKQFTGGCYAPARFGGSDTNYLPPSDRPAPTIEEMPPSMQQTLIALGSIQAVGVFVATGVLIRYRKTRLVKASQPALMWLVLLACLLGSARIGLFQAPVNDGVCVAGYWAGHVSFVLGITALFVKTLRVHMVVNATHMRHVKFTTQKALALYGSIVFTVVLYLAIVTGISAPQKRTLAVIQISGEVIRSHHCAVPLRVLDTIIYVLEAVLLALTTKLCYDTKDVPDAVNEAKPIVIAISIIAVISAAGFSIAIVLPVDSFIMSFALGVCFFVACTLALLAYFGPKAYLLLTGADLNRQFKIVRKGSVPKKNTGNGTGPTVVGSSSGMVVPGDPSAAAAATATNKSDSDEPLRKSVIALYLTEAPKTQEHCRIIIEHIQELLMTLDLRSANGISTSKSSAHPNQPHQQHQVVSTMHGQGESIEPGAIGFGRNSNASIYSNHSSHAT